MWVENALKALFNISKFSKNHLNYILHIDHISTILIRNKFNLCCRLLKNNFTRQIMFNMMEKKIGSQSNFINNIVRITAELDIDFYDLIINKRFPRIYSYFENIPESTKNILKQCIQFWNFRSSRNEFRNILQENVTNST